MRVRLVTVDDTPPLPPSWRRTVEAYEGLDGVFDQVEVAFAREEAPLELSPTDRFIATTWWTAHLAQAAAKSLGAQRFVYLIQECEPFSFPMGAFAALARQSYGFPHFAVFSTELLRDYFRRHSLGVYAAGAEAGDRDSVTFENAITPIEPPAEADLARRSSRRLLLYARPEPHAARNMFELAILALAKAVSSFENKTAEAMSAISRNLITAEPSIEGVAGGLREAVAGVGDAARRAAGARVRWSRDWDTSFDDRLLGRVASFLESC
jgi:hypothetical protein